MCNEWTQWPFCFPKNEYYFRFVLLRRSESERTKYYSLFFLLAVLLFLFLYHYYIYFASKFRMARNVFVENNNRTFSVSFISSNEPKWLPKSDDQMNAWASFFYWTWFVELLENISRMKSFCLMDNITHSNLFEQICSDLARHKFSIAFNVNIEAIQYIQKTSFWIMTYILVIKIDSYKLKSFEI